jgi:hypothetical protein
MSLLSADSWERSRLGFAPEEKTGLRVVFKGNSDLPCATWSHQRRFASLSASIFAMYRPTRLRSGQLMPKLSRMTRRTAAALAGAAAAAAVLVTGCSVGIRRDLSAVPPGQVGFDDMCGLQPYFDALEIKSSPPPRLVSAVDLEGPSGNKMVRGGKERFAFENDFQLKNVRRVLNDNWSRLPEPLEKASEIDIEVKWSEKAGAKRVITEEPAELSVGPESWSLPYQVCLSELLYGEPLYRQRREMWGLPLPGKPVTPAPAPAATTVKAAAVTPTDGGAPASDGGSGRE